MKFDLIIVGGGIGGSTLGKVMAEGGFRVLILEREKFFKDRVRGEGMHPWGVAEAQDLGIYDLLVDQCAHKVRWWSLYFGSKLRERRDLVNTTPHKNGCLNFYHSKMQQALLEAAANAGAEVRRGTTVVDVSRGEILTAQARTADGEIQKYQARLIAGVDGRGSNTRSLTGFAVRRDPERLVIAGVLFEGLCVSEDSVHVVCNPTLGQSVLLFPIGNNRFRIYFIYRKRDKYYQLSGKRHIPDFIDLCTVTGAPEEWFQSAEVIGPLANFDCTDTWVDHPYQGGVVLVGDAAATPDPSWGSGLSITLRDVRVLRKHLIGIKDWNIAAHDYAKEHDRYYGALHRVERWLTDLFYECGYEADTRRARALPVLAREPDRWLDIVGLGPEAPSEEVSRQRLFAEDLSNQ